MYYKLNQLRVLQKKLVCAIVTIVSTFLIFMFADQLLLVDVFSKLGYLTSARKQQWGTSIISI